HAQGRRQRGTNRNSKQPRGANHVCRVHGAEGARADARQTAAKQRSGKWVAPRSVAARVSSPFRASSCHNRLARANLPRGAQKARKVVGVKGRKQLRATARGVSNEREQAMRKPVSANLPAHAQRMRTAAVAAQSRKVRKQKGLRVEQAAAASGAELHQ